MKNQGNVVPIECSSPPGTGPPKGDAGVTEQRTQNNHFNGAQRAARKHGQATGWYQESMEEGSEKCNEEERKYV